MVFFNFGWDNRKNQANEKKHGISFEEAKSVFYDEHARLIYDPDHSTNEDRYILLGMSLKFRILVICHCYRNQESLIRIISARKATREEQKKYKEKFL